jgi:Phage integrase central domain/Arm DNA-binding domain
MIDSNTSKGCGPPVYGATHARNSRTALEIPGARAGVSCRWRKSVLASDRGRRGQAAQVLGISLRARWPQSAGRRPWQPERCELAEARETARQYRNLVRDGIDPIEHRRAKVAANLAASAKVLTFDQATAAYVAQHRSSWGNLAHARQWTKSMARYASPVLGRLAVDAIETVHIKKTLDAIWHAKPEAASRVRARVEAVLDTGPVHKSGGTAARPSALPAHISRNRFGNRFPSF